MPRPAQRYAAVSLFAGCGGMDLGAEQSGRAKVVWAIDNDHWAVETYRRNLGRHIVEADITETPVPEVPCDILLAGPPCQDYSTLWNHDGLKTARGNLFRQVARFSMPCARPDSCSRTSRACCPRTEVQHGLSYGTHCGHRRALPVHSGAARRYAMTLARRSSTWPTSAFAQHRERLIVVGVRRDLAVRPPVIPTPFAGKPLTVREVLDDNPLPPDAPNHEVGLDTPGRHRATQTNPARQQLRSHP